MAEHAREVGDVREEAARLVQAAGRWLDAVPSPRTAPEPGADAGEETESPPAGASGGEPAGASGGESGATAAGPSCPWCRARAALGPTGADTLDSLANLLAMAADSLHHLADARREPTGEPAGGPTGEPSGRRAEPAAEVRATSGDAEVRATSGEAEGDVAGDRAR